MYKKMQLLISIGIVFILTSSFSGCFESSAKVDFSYAPETPIVGNSIQFVSPSGSFVKFLWDFGDGNTSSEKNPSHAYVSSGTYAVRLTIWDSDGNSFSVVKTVTVSSNITNNPPTAPELSLGYTGDLEPWIIYPIFANSTDKDGDNISYCYDWGDGSSSCNLYRYWRSGFTFKEAHSWESPGTYVVKVKAVDSRGAESNYSLINVSVVDSHTIPYFNISTISGGTFSVSDNIGKVIIIELFATSCGGCGPEVADLKEIYEKYSKDDVVIISISAQYFNPFTETLENVTKFKEENGADWDFAIDTLSTNVTGKFIKGYTSGFSVPALFVLDKQGYISYSAQGHLTADALMTILDKLI